MKDTDRLNSGKREEFAGQNLPVAIITSEQSRTTLML